MKKKSLLVLASLTALGTFAGCLTGCKTDDNNTHQDTTIHVTGVSLDATTKSLFVGDEATLVATVAPENATDKTVTWSSSDTSIATVSEGKVTAVAPGQATITATSTDGAKTATCVVNVQRVAINATGVSLDLDAKEIFAGESFQLNATVAPGDADNKNVTWSSSNTAAATVTEGGKVTGVAEGEATITVTTVDGGFTATCTVTVKRVLVPTVTVATEGDATIMDVGTTLQCSANVIDLENTNVTWSSSNTSVATVDENGLVTATSSFVRAADVTITATSVEDSTVKGSIDLTVKKLDIEGVYVAQVTKNQNFVKFDANKAAQANEENTFAVTNLDHQVGDDSAVDFKPGMSYINADEDPVVFTGNWYYHIGLQKYNAETGEYVDVTLNDYVDEVDNVNCKVNFNEAAIGGKFKVTVTPEALTDNQKAAEGFNDYYCVSYEVVVEDGYNVYSAADFAYFENRAKYNVHQVADGQTAAAWKETKGYSTTTFYDNFVLQTNITFTDDDIPDGFKVDSDYCTEKGMGTEYVGSLLDNKDIYFHVVKNGQTDYIDGNYFTLDASQVSLVPYTGSDDYAANHRVSHTSLFRTNTLTDYDGDTNKENTDGKFEIRNLNMNGNAANGGDEENAWENGGGLIFMKNEYTGVKFYNSISRGWFISYYPNNNVYDEFVVEKCKAYDSYSNFVYCWGSSLTIKDSIMKQAGGPCIIADDRTMSDDDMSNDKPSHIYIDANSDLESYVAGQEAWFQSFTGATTIAGSIKDMDKLLNAAGRSFLRIKEDEAASYSSSTTTKYFNFIVLYKDAGAEGLTTRKLCGDIQFGVGHTYDFKEGDASIASSGATSLYDGATGNYPIFVSSDSTSETSGPAMYLAGANDSKAGSLTDCYDSSTWTTGISTSADVFKGDHLALYYNGMCICFTYDSFNTANYATGTNPYQTW